MVTRVVVVHEDIEFLAELERRLRDAGHDVAAFQDSISAYDALRGPQRVGVLVTQVLFEPGQPHGIALAGAARINRPSLKVIFIALPEVADHVADQEHVLMMPARADQIVQAVRELLSAPSPDA